MNILILVDSFPPEVGSVSHLFYELAKGLTEKGHKITVVTSFPRNYVDLDKIEGKYKGKLFLKEEMEGIKVIRLKQPGLPRGIPVIRSLEQLITALLVVIGGLFSEKQDIILMYSPPLTLGVSSYLLKKIKRAPSVANVQDLYPQTAIDLGLLKNSMLIRFGNLLEKFLYEKSDYITVHSKGNKERIVNKTDTKIEVIPNWVDTEFIKSSNKSNEFREENNLGSKFIVSFAGKMGFAQDIDIIIEAARYLNSNKDILFLLIGDGVKKEEAVKKAEEFNLDNVKFLPLQPKEKYPSVLNASDVSLATLKKDLRTPVVPGKIMSIMASGRPVIVSASKNSDARNLVREAACGLSVNPDLPQELAESILKLYKNDKLREKLGENGREYAEKNLSKKVCINKYEKLFFKISGCYET